jgi:hypothetical protein
MNRLLSYCLPAGTILSRTAGRGLESRSASTTGANMNKTMLVCALVLFATYCPAANGAVFERDWTTPGDGLLTYDDVNRREWLDLSVSRLDQFPQPRLENALAEIGPGGIFEGFTFAERADVIPFAQSAGINTSTFNFATNEQPTADLIELLSVTFQNSATVRSIGYIDEPTGNPRVGADFHVQFNSITGEGSMAGLFLSGDLLSITVPGLMLFRNIPEPSWGLLVLEAFCSLECLAYRRRIRRRC